MTRRPFLQLVVAFAAGAGTNAFALTVAQLQKLLRSGERPTVSFREIRESPWLAAPMVTQGTMRSTPEGLEKKVESPVHETWRLLDDRVEWESADGRSKSIPFATAPALGALSAILRSVMAGNLVDLQREFDIRVDGDEHAWRAQLVPRAPGVRQALDSVEVQGAGGTVRVLIVVDRQGEKTTTTFER